MEWDALNTTLPWEGGVGCIEVNRGWVGLIAELHDDLSTIYPDYEVLQVKEKFGGLRFYVGMIPEEFDQEFYARIRNAEEEADRTCEICGTVGDLCRSKSGWYRTACASCATKGEMTKCEDEE